jgi:hypothetical protein
VSGWALGLTISGGLFQLAGFAVVAIASERTRRRLWPSTPPVRRRIKVRVLKLVGRYHPTITGHGSAQAIKGAVPPARDIAAGPAFPYGADVADQIAWLHATVAELDARVRDEGTRLRWTIEHVQDVQHERISELESDAIRSSSEFRALQQDALSTELRGVVLFSIGVVCSTLGSVLA